MKPSELIYKKRRHALRLVNEHGAAGEARAVAASDNWVPRPTGIGMRTLLGELERTGIVIKRTSFDAIALPGTEAIDFTDVEAVRAALPDMTFIEIKTANQKRVKPDFTGFFFSISEGEIAASELLGDRFVVALQNGASGAILLTTVPAIFERMKSDNWQVSVQL